MPGCVRPRRSARCSAPSTRAPSWACRRPRSPRRAGSAAIIGAASATPYAAVGAYCRNGPAAIRAGAAPYAANLAHMDFDLGGVDLRRRRHHGRRLRRRRHRRGRPRRQPRSHPRRRGHAARPRPRAADARRRRLGADPDARGVRRPAADHDPPDRRAHRLARGGAGRAPRPLLHHAARVRDGRTSSASSRSASARSARPASATTPTPSRRASSSSRRATCTPTASRPCWS